MRFRVLHLDDDPNALDLTDRVLTGVDDRIDVTGVDGPDRALAALEDGYDCVVADSVRTAEGVPFAVAARRRAPDVPILLFTGHDWPAVAETAERAGAAGYVRKAGVASFATLGARIARLVDGSSSDLSGADTSGDPLTSVETTAGVSTLDCSPAAGWREIGSHDAEDGDELVVSLIEALAEATALDVDDLSPLYEVVDPEALEAFLARSGEARATFVYLGREIAIDGSGTFAVRPLGE